MLKKAREVAKKFLFTVNDNPISRANYKKIIEKRSVLPFTEIQELAKDISPFSPYTYEIHPSNDFYGIASAIKDFVGMDQKYPFKFSIEHGIVLTDELSQIDVDSPFDSILTFGTDRAKFLKKYKSHVYTIGPYIHYAKSLLSAEEIAKEKKRLGKNLLVFPSHSTPDIIGEFDVEKFCKEIKKKFKDFQNIRICIYWKDVQRGVDVHYKKHGFECVTAGHVYDTNFLRRLRSIIECSTVTVSNDIGDQLGYSVVLKKPHHILYHEVKYTGRKSEVKLVNDLYTSSTYQLFRDTFAPINNKISKKQFDLVSKYWGFEHLKTKTELLKIIKETEKIRS